jgi:hypothetical protein
VQFSRGRLRSLQAGSGAASPTATGRGAGTIQAKDKLRSLREHNRLREHLEELERARSQAPRRVGGRTLEQDSEQLRQALRQIKRACGRALSCSSVGHSEVKPPRRRVVAGRGRPPQAAARRPALRRVEEVVTSGTISGLTVRCFRNGRSNDHSRTAGVRHTWQAGVDGHAGVHAALTPRTVSGRLPHVGHRCGHGVGPRRPPRHGNVRRSRIRSGTSATAGLGRLK